MKWLKKVAVTPLERVAKVIDNVAEQVNDRFNAPSIHAVREYVNENMLTIYPVGSIYLSVNPDDPGLVFGGTWERIKDKFLLAAGDTYEAGHTGGSATHNHYASASVAGHVLTTNEIPAHKHTVTGAALAPSGKGILTASTELGAAEGSATVSKITSSTGTLDLSLEMNNTGGGQAHNHSATVSVGTQSSMPPYLVVYVFKRIA
jgi:hypothetical protein